MIRVLIRASSPAMRAGIEGLLRAHPQFEVVTEPEDEGSGGAPAEPPDVILAESQDRDDPALSELLSQAGEDLPVILLVRGPAAEWVDLRREGVRAILQGSVTGAQIAAAVEAVVAGLTVFESGELDEILGPARANGLRKIPEPLTPREIEVLRLMAEGLANKHIAERLAISDHTVKFHVASVMGKLGAASRTEAVTIGIRHGLVLL